MTHRRDLLRTAAALPLGMLALRGETTSAAAALKPPPFTISVNIEIMFNTGRGNLPMPRADRIRAVAAKGFKAYSFWNATPDERKAMIRAQEETGLKCVSLVGTGNAGGTTGFTKPGAQESLLAEIKERIEIAKEFGTQPDLITFVGIIQPDVPWETQRTQIVEGLKRAGDLAAAGGVTIAVEPLSVNPGQPRRALDRCVEAFPVIKDVAHPNVKICFDLYHLQRTEGNLVVSLRNGLQDKLIKIVQVGDNPGRLEPGTGEIHYPFIFSELRRLNWTGYVDTEHGTSSTADHAMDVVRTMAEEN
ncbi:MAG: TIM barrel protein [Vicinamibacterales bacterium]